MTKLSCLGHEFARLAPIGRRVEIVDRSRHRDRVIATGFKPVWQTLASLARESMGSYMPSPAAYSLAASFLSALPTS